MFSIWRSGSSPRVTSAKLTPLFHSHGVMANLYASTRCLFQLVPGESALREILFLTNPVHYASLLVLIQSFLNVASETTEKKGRDPSVSARSVLSRWFNLSRSIDQSHGRARSFVATTYELAYTCAYQPRRRHQGDRNRNELRKSTKLPFAVLKRGQESIHPYTVQPHQTGLP